MKILFCADPLHPRRVDEAFQAEYEAASSAGAEISPVNFEALVYENDPATAAARVMAADARTLAVYRGWMLTVEQYTRLFEALREREIVLIDTPEQYAHCHWLPLSYAEIAAHTPRAVWVAKEDYRKEDYRKEDYRKEDYRKEDYRKEDLAALLQPLLGQRRIHRRAAAA